MKMRCQNYIGPLVVLFALACNGDSGQSSSETNQACVQECVAKGEPQSGCEVACDVWGAKEESKEGDGGAAKEEGAKAPSDITVLELSVDGVVRNYHMVAPSNASTASGLALLMAIHGGGEGDYDFPQTSLFEEIAQEEGALVVFPHAKLLGGNEGAWLLNTTAQRREDINFIGALIDDLASRFDIDAARIYATGYSLGSMFTYELACQMSSRFAAIASYAGTMPVSPQDCSPERFVPLMHIHGDADEIIPYSATWDWKNWSEVGTMRDIPGLADYWKTKYGCENAATEDLSGHSHTTYTQCAQDSRVEHLRLFGQGHGWPDTIGGTSTARVMWSFLSSFTKP